MWDALINFILGINFLDGFVAIVLTFLFFFLRLLPNYDHLPFGENNHYIMGVVLLVGNLLLIRFVRYISNKIKERSYAESERKVELARELREYQELIDSLSSSNLEFVVGLLNTENKVFYTFKITRFDHFFNSEYVRRFECIDQKVIKEHREKGYYAIDGMDVEVVVGYQLEDWFYYKLMQSYKMYGKISVSGREKDLLRIEQKA